MRYSAKGAYFTPQNKRYRAWQAAVARAKRKGVYKREKPRLDKMRRGTWDGKVRFYRWFTGNKVVISIYLLSLIRPILDKMGAEYTYEGGTRPRQNRKPYPIPELPAPDNRDYSYQKLCVDHFVKGKKRCGLLHLAPNAGKTEIYLQIITGLNLPAIISSYNKTAVMNLYDRLVNYLGKKYVGLYAAGRRDVREDYITVVLLPSIARKAIPASLRRQPLWISDECHQHVGAQQRLHAARDGAYINIGGSGTIPATKEARLTLGSMFGRVLHTEKPKDLERRGISSIAEHRFVRYEAPSYITEEIDELSYANWYRKCIVDNKPRNQLVVDICKTEVGRGKLGIVFVRLKRHGRILTQRLEKLGLNVEYAHGDLSPEHRDRIVKRMKRGKLDVVVGTSILNTALNVANIRFTVAAVGEYSANRKGQEVGRSARLKSEDNQARNWEFYDDASPRMLEHTQRRLKALKKTGSKVIVEKKIRG